MQGEQTDTVAAGEDAWIDVPGLSYKVPPGLKLDPLGVHRTATEWVPAHVALGTQMVAMTRKGLTFALDWREELVGDPETGALMGGVVTSLFDQACGMAAVIAANGAWSPVATLDLRVDYLKPSTRGKTLHVQAKCYKATRHVAFMRGHAYHPDTPDDLIATCVSTFVVDGTGSYVTMAMSSTR